MKSFIMEYELTQERMAESDVQKLAEAIGFKLFYEPNKRIFAPSSGPVKRWPTETEVYISFLPSNINENLLYAHFSKFGKIIQIRTMVNPVGKSWNFAYILYETREQAWSAVDQCNGRKLKFLNGQYWLQVSMSTDNRRLFVGRIPMNLTREQMWKIIHHASPGLVNIFSYKKWYDHKTNRGYCFLEYASHQDATEAIPKLKTFFANCGLEGVLVNWARPEPLIHPVIMENVKTIFIRGLKLRTTKAQVVHAVCEGIGASPDTVIHVRRNLHYAFITFSNRNLAIAALVRLQGAVIDGAQVEFQLARPDVNLSSWKSGSPKQQSVFQHHGRIQALEDIPKMNGMEVKPFQLFPASL